MHNAVHGISLQVSAGEILAIVGESGSGKSVTALSVLQLLPKNVRYSDGQISFNKNGGSAVDLLKAGSKKLGRIRGNDIAMIFQEPMSSLNPVLSCGHQVMEAIRQHRKMTAAKAKEKTVALFAQVQLPNPDKIFSRYPHQLSGGQKQRVMIAMAMSSNPALLICDEPTTALDVTVQKNILQLIKQLQQQTGMGVIFITHDLGVVAEIADTVAVMYRGNIVEQGPAKQVLQNPQHAYTKGLLACRPVLHKKGERLPVVSDFMHPDSSVLSTLNNNLTSNTAFTQPGEKLIEVKQLSVWFANKRNFFGKSTSHIKAVDEVSFSIYAGETLGLVGESGCGKTTLGRALLRLIEPTAGEIIFNGQNLLKYDSSELRKARRDIQLVFQDPYASLNPAIIVGHAIEEVLQVHNMLPTARQRKERVMELLEKVSLQHGHYNRYPHQFSGGQRQRIVIARALAVNPSFVVCDESVSALDVSVQAQVLNLLNDLKKEFQFTILFISHDLGVVHYISDRIMVMQKGKIIETGTAEQVYHHPQELYTQNLVAAIPGKKV